MNEEDEAAILASGDNPDQTFKPKSSMDTSLLKYQVQKNEPSGILKDIQISNLCEHLPAYMRHSKWKRIFAMERDGTSLITFFRNC